MQRRHFIQSAGALALGTALSPLISQTAFAAPQAAGTLEVFAGAIGPGMYNGGTFAQARFHDPRGMALDAQGNIFVADYVNSLVRKLGTDGQVSIVAGQVEQRDARNGPALQARFYSPECVAVATDGTLFVSDSGSNTVRRISPDGRVSTLAGKLEVEGFADGPGQQARFNHPVGLGVNAQGVVYVADAYNSTVRRISAKGVVSTLAGSPGDTGWRDGRGAQARFNTPVGLTLDAQGQIYVSEYFNNVIRKITPDGTVTTFAGKPGKGGFADGNVEEALFLHPQTLSFAPDGSLIVADTGNNRVRRISPQGEVSTLAGTGAGEKVTTGALPAGLHLPYGVLALADGSVLVTGLNAILRIQPSKPLKA
jgi:streptogramin lyase